MSTHALDRPSIKGRTRFQGLKDFGDVAVLDKETGLVREQSPSTDTFTWDFALYHCATLAVGGRAGWRLPAISELMRLVDPSVPVPGLTLPDGNPLANVQSEPTAENPNPFYWTASNGPFSSDAAFAFEMNFRFGVGSVTTTGKAADKHAWCVRGGAGVDPQT